jgi:hypothetical protein
MGKKIAIIIALIAAACTSADKARQTLEAEGYTHIKIGGYSFSCSDSDSTCTKFEAISPGGKRVHGGVGCGYVLKGCTVRIEP